jgi:Zn finger protein HypA/HybF involved in hydrogenase expression
MPLWYNGNHASLVKMKFRFDSGQWLFRFVLAVRICYRLFMMKCLNDECENLAKVKFCSRSCSAKVNNRGVRRHGESSRGLSNCVNCGSELKPRQTKFCKPSCQKELQRSELIAEWLKTGTAIVSSRKSHYIRQYILEEQNHTCAICPTGVKWFGKGLTLILDHIDGNSENSARSNLRLICPNCDSQLDTYKAKNKGNGRHSRRERYRNGQSY